MVDETREGARVVTHVVHHQNAGRVRANDSGHRSHRTWSMTTEGEVMSEPRDPQLIREEQDGDDWKYERDDDAWHHEMIEPDAHDEQPDDD